jgi:hypothetical protein
MVATQTTPRLATVLATRHSPGTMTRVCRLAFAVMFTGGAAIHVAIVVTGTETYRHVADTAFIPFVKQAWLSVFMPHAALFGLLLAAFELVVGLLILAGGRNTTLGLLAALVFHLGLMLFGWGLWFWSLPMVAMLVPLLRDDFGNLWGPRRRTPVSGWAAAPARREPSGARCFPATSSSTTPPW